MKKITLVLFTLLTLLPLSAWADEVEIDGITYETSGTKATVITCADATTIIIPNEVSISETNYSITGIDKEAFKNCGKLQTLTINNPDLLENLDIDFVGSKVLTPLTIICKGIKYKHNGQWSGATNFFAVGDGNNGSGYDSATADENLIVLETVCGISVTTIADKAFNNNGGNKSIYLPKSITTISNISFSENKLSAFSIDNANAHFSVKYGVLFDKDGKKLISFPSQKANSYIIPNGVTTIGKDAFNNHQSLTSITIPASVETIEESAFNRAGANTELSVIFSGTSNLKSIDKSAFQQSGINSITLPNGITTIGDQAFQKCTKLTSINLPSSLTSIGGSAFNGCSTLSTINFAASYTALTIGSNAFYDCKLAETITLTEGITTIGKNAFNHSSSFTSLLQNLKLPTTATFTDNIANEYTTVTRKVDINWNGSNWATYYSNMDLDLPTGLEAYTITNVDGTNIVTQALHYIHANEAVLLKRAEGASLPEYYGLPNSSTIDEDNGVSFNHNLFIGTANGISNIATISGDKYVLDGDKFVKAHQGSLPAFRCYLVLNNGDGAQPSTIYLTDTGNNTFIIQEEGTLVNKNTTTIGSASLSSTTDGKMKLTVTPGTSGNYYAYKSDITIRKNVTAVSGRAPSLDNTTWTGDDLTIVGDNQDPDPSGKIEYTFDPNGTTEFEVTVNFHKRKFFNDNSTYRDVTLEYTSTTYDGGAKAPAVTQVKFGADKETAVIVDSKNYTISYENNIAAGTGSVIITGQREFKSTYTKNFSIGKRDINNITVNEKLLADCTEEQRLVKIYTGSAITLTAEELGISDLKAGSTTEQAITENDYQVTYENNTNVSTTTANARINIVSKTSSGANYQNTKVLYFKIVPKEMTANDITIGDQEWTGSAVEPNPTIVYNNKTLTKGEDNDYTIAYANNINSGKATATFTFRGNYTGTVVKEFGIKDHAQSISVKFDNPDNQWTTYYYKENLALPTDGSLEAYVITGRNGKEVKTQKVNFIPKNTPVLLYSTSGKKEFDLTTDYNATTDVTPANIFKGTEEGVDIKTISGTTFVLVNGKFVQAAEGTLAANRCYLVIADAIDGVTTLTINKAGNAFIYQEDGTTTTASIGTASTSDPENGKVTLTVNPKYGYYINGTEDITVIKNANAVKGRAMQIDGGGVTVTAGKITENDDNSSTYLFTYPSENDCQYQIIVNFHKATSFQESGKQPTINFAQTIYNGQEQKTKPTIIPYGGTEPLTEGVDYILTYSDNDYTKAADKKNVKVIGIRKYFNDLAKTFNIEKRDLSMIKPVAKEGQQWKSGLDTTSPQVYFSGSAMELNFTDIVKNAQNQNLDLLKQNEEITVTYSNNTAVGTATATIKSKGVNYKGTERTITFQILQKRLTTNDVTINDIPDQSYTGNEIAPVLTIKYNNVTLMEGADKDYTVTYSNNTNAGEATATITFLGNYSGTITKTFKITEAEETVKINFDSANEWTTYYSAKNLSLTNELEAFVVTGIEGATLNTASVDFIPQSTPVLLHRKSGTNTTFNVMTCSTESLDASITPNSIFKGSLESTDISTADADMTKFILLNGQFVQTTEGTLDANRCYIILNTPPTGVNILTIGKPSDGIIILEEGNVPQQSNVIGTVNKATGNDKATLTVKANNGWYAEAKDITVVRSANANKGRAPQVNGNNVTLTSGEITTNEDYSTTYLFTYPYSSDYQYQVTVNFHKSTKLNEANPTITLNPTSYEYDKSEKTPEVTVKIGEEVLTKDVDYVVSYENNVNKGRGKVNVNGIRKYANGTYSEFNISQRDIKNVTVGAIEAQTFTGKEITPELTITDVVNEEDIITTDEYSIEYNQNINAGQATVTIIGKDNYTNSKSITFNIVPKTMTAENIKDVPQQTYTGNEVKPGLTISYLDNTIVEETDYDVEYINNVNAGEATAKVTFKGNYAGVVEKKFIIGDHGQTVSVNFENPDNQWTTYYYKENVALPTDGSLKAYVVTGYKNKEVQTEEVNFIPKNTPVLLYSESGEKNFNLTTNYSATTNVTPANIFKGTEEGVDIKTISGTTFVLVNGKFVLAAEGTLAANRCYLVISDEEAKKIGVSELTIKSTGNEIIYQQDGKANNSIGTASTSTPKDGKVILTVKPKKGYYINGTEDITVIKNAKAESARAQKIDDGKVTVNAGKITDNADHTSTYLFTYPYEQNCQYQITVNFHQATNITETGKQPTITFKDDVVYNGLEQKAEPEVVTYDGTKLTKNVDYVLSYPGDDYINAGTGKKVTVTGIRKYINELSQNSFEIKPRNISELTISGQEGQAWIEGHTPADATPQIVYTSKAIELNVSDDIEVEGAKKSIINENDITVTYSNNLNAGTATVTIKNKQGGNYTGERVFNFEIVAMMMTADKIDAIPDQHYTGKAITPDITVKNGAITLVKGTDYEVDYSNNTDAGEATAIVNFKGNYAGENVKKTFKILEVEEEHTINFDNKNEWTTYYYDKNLSLPEEVEAFVVTGIEGSTLNTAPVDFIPQNTPVLLRRMSGTNTTFSVKTCSTKRLDESTVPNTDLFKGSLEGIANIKTVDTDKAKFILLNNEFVQTTEGALGANRCYLAVSAPAEGINTLTIGNPTMDIVILEDNATPQQANIIGKASKSTNGTTTTLTVTANNGWYVEANDITVVRSTNAEKGRAPQVGGENIKVNAGKRTDHENYTTTYLFTYPYSSDYTYQVKVNFHKSTRLNEAKPTITLNPTSFEYDNSEKKPSVTVKIGDVTLKEKEDYVISYENNILPSTEVKGNVLINGIRKYATQVNKNFDINRRDINKAVIEGIEKTTLTYTGNEVEWKIKDLVKNENIIKEDDYTFTCSKEMIKDAGEYTITLEGSNNYQGKKEVTFTIQPKNLTGKAVIDPIEAINENGSPITPALTIKDGAITLNPETDYDVTYTNNVEDGKATATITFKGNYTGKAETNFTINHVAKDVPLNITFDKDNEWTTFFYTNNIIVPDGLKAYIIIGLNGKDITPKEVDFIPENVPVLLYREDKSKSDAFIGKTMPSDTKLSENIKPDSRFCGTLESIDIKTISGNKFVLLDNMFVQAVEGTLAANHCYINATISDVAELAIGKAIDARIYLEEGNPSTVGGIAETSTPDENGLITLTIKPNPNFYAEAKDIKVVSSASANDARAPQIDGSHVELTPVDETADPSGETQYTYKYSEGYHYQITVNFHKCVNFTNKETRPTVSITETSFVYNGTERKPIPTVIYNGVPLIENTDYAVIYQNNFNAGGASVVIKGKGHYSGEFIGATFNITKRSINSDNVKVEFKQNSFTYTGSPIKPEFTVTETITVGEETINIITTDDYEIAEWDNNTNASTSEKKAKLALHGIRNYDDFKDVYFEIQPKRLYKSNIKAIDNQEYTGSPIQPELTIMDGEYTLTSDDYDVKYSNNIYEGTAYVDVTFKGNYMGKVQTTFDILYRSLKREIDITFEGSNQWTTFYWNENLDIEGQGLTAYVVTGHEQGSTKLITEEVNFIPKNTGVLLYRTNTANAGPFYGMTMPTNTKLEGVTPDRNLFVGSMDSKDLADVKGVKFILVNDQFVQTTEGMLAAHRCYANFGDGKGIEGISNIETDKDLDAIIYKEEGEDRKAGSIGTVTLSEPQNGRKTLTVEPKPGFYAEPENITIIRSVDGTTARAAQVPSVEDKVVVTATNPSANPSKKTTYTFPYEEGYHYQIIVDFQKCADFTKGVTITLGNQTFEYDGNEKKPTVTAVYIKDNNGRNIKLKSNYYTISYANNINAGGAARVIVEGNWYYYGANGVNFNISQRDISKAKIEVNIPTQIYTGKPIEIDPKYIVVSDMVTINGKQKNIITENDYELVYSNNVEAGTAKVTVMPTKINYNGHGREYTFNIIMPIKGDANRDGLVNVTDIVEIVNYILGRPTSRFYFEGADVNEDGLVNVTDIVLVVNIILNGDNSVATREAIDEALADIWDEYVTAINNIKQEETVDVFDLKGRKVRANATDLKGLPQGVYIVRDKKMNTKKVFVK